MKLSTTILILIVISLFFTCWNFAELSIIQEDMPSTSDILYSEIVSITGGTFIQSTTPVEYIDSEAYISDAYIPKNKSKNKSQVSQMASQFSVIQPIVVVIIGTVLFDFRLLAAFLIFQALINQKPLFGERTKSLLVQMGP